MRNLFFINVYRVGRYNESIGSFYKVLAKDPTNILALAAKGSALDNLGKRNESIPFLTSYSVCWQSFGYRFKER